MSRLKVVVPCYNEASRLSLESFVHFAASHPCIEFLMVDDGSTDATPRMLEELCQSHPAQFQRLLLKTNQGKAEAVRQGMLLAMDDRADYVAFLDADLATPLQELPRMMSVLDEQSHVSIVLGTRLSLLGRSIARRRVRFWLGRCFAAAASRVLRTRIHDTQCGLKMFRSVAGTRRLFSEPFLSRWVFDVECLARFLVDRGHLKARLELYEFPLHRWEEIPGSRTRPADFVRAARELVAIYRKYAIAAFPQATVVDEGELLTMPPRVANPIPRETSDHPPRRVAA